MGCCTTTRTAALYCCLWFCRVFRFRRPSAEVASLDTWQYHTKRFNTHNEQAILVSRVSLVARCNIYLVVYPIPLCVPDCPRNFCNARSSCGGSCPNFGSKSLDSSLQSNYSISRPRSNIRSNPLLDGDFERYRRGALFGVYLL